jgi:hypothetical protein
MNSRIQETSIDPAAAIAELEAHVRCRLGGQLRHFRLDVVEEGVVLRGLAHTYYAKQLAQHEVMRACGRPIVANEIVVT